MKKTILLVLAVMTAGVTMAKGPLSESFRKPLPAIKGGGSDVQNVIKFKPVGLAIGAITLQYERVLNENMTVGSDLTYLGYSYTETIGGASGKAKMTGFGLSPEFRFYTGGEAPKGFYIGPFLEYYSLSIEFSGSNVFGETKTGKVSGFSAIGGGALLGYQFLIGGAFSLDLNLGVRYISISTPESIETTTTSGGTTTTQKEILPSVSIAGVAPAGNISLGYAF